MFGLRQYDHTIYLGYAMNMTVNTFNGNLYIYSCVIINNSYFITKVYSINGVRMQKLYFIVLCKQTINSVNNHTTKHA
jgi:hypothetical protein